jgi:hypothetical protein
MTVQRFNPPAVNDERQHRSYAVMNECSGGDFVSFDDYACLQDNQRTLRATSRLTMLLIKKSCADVIAAHMANSEDPQVAKALKTLEEDIRNMKVDYSVFQPREER